MNELELIDILIGLVGALIATGVRLIWMKLRMVEDQLSEQHDDLILIKAKLGITNHVS